MLFKLLLILRLTAVHAAIAQEAHSNSQTSQYNGEKVIFQQKHIYPQHEDQEVVAESNQPNAINPIESGTQNEFEEKYLNVLELNSSTTDTEFEGMRAEYDNIDGKHSLVQTSEEVVKESRQIKARTKPETKTSDTVRSVNRQPGRTTMSDYRSVSNDM
ncbi:unnamed protein product [Schistocephalus solidus]|uniref:Secreted protein n=1 Tax=Schistocephalus solidus TaxID=70667 RepID=A0A183TU11_SCHSO|nr:unnamed protein product [Schistocephalus solidus]